MIPKKWKDLRCLEACSQSSVLHPFDYGLSCVGGSVHTSILEKEMVL